MSNGGRATQAGTTVIDAARVTDPTPTARPLRVVTWNMNHWRQSRVPLDTHRAAWRHLAEDIGADVVLAQEAVPADDLPADRTVYTEIAGHRPWGSAVVALPADASLRPLRAVRWECQPDLAPP